jgi:hypothetical protein
VPATQAVPSAQEIPTHLASTHAPCAQTLFASHVAPEQSLGKHWAAAQASPCGQLTPTHLVAVQTPLTHTSPASQGAPTEQSGK